MGKEVIVGVAFRLDKKDFGQFIKQIAKSYEVIAPVKTDVVRFQKVKAAADIDLSKNSFFPVKEYFFPQEEVIYTFTKKGFTVPKLAHPQRVFFGLRKCDLNAIRHQDLVYLEDAQDPYYTNRREHSVIIGYHCEEPPMPYCFCGSLKLVEFHDLMFYDRKDHFLVDIGSERGRSFIQECTLFKETTILITESEKAIKGADRLKKLDLNQIYNHADWKKGVDKCLSCTACTALCPTCYCFEIHDDVQTKDATKGERKRTWSSCQLPEFTRIAGNYVFRKDREQRFKHRIYHQLDYFKEKYGVTMCVGCGRCIEACPTRIDFVDIINNMK
jgi:sulfhydrogenase subunit beta (sulfur reductase)